ncbi:MAG: hypothetical protein AW12_03013 [Candidatus Accumulibacter sp. BA-94]|nr:MAG: hypothetical protein AW12_03013 [Candidatus Accumulibacter sp. BA-94]
MFARIEVNGDHAHPLYQYLKQAAPGLLGSEAIKWNFTKFLVDRAGCSATRRQPPRTASRVTSRSCCEPLRPAGS